MDFCGYLEQKIAQYQAENEQLLAADRRDEAVFLRIRQNVCEIVKTVHNVLEPAAFEQKMEQLQSTWSATWDKAAHHGDGNRAYIEDVKLAELREILQKYRGEA